MTSGQMRTLKKKFEELQDLGSTKTKRDQLAEGIFNYYQSLGRAATNQQFEEDFELYDLSRCIFKAANKEVIENGEKWRKEQGKENKTASQKKYKTKLFELSIYHIKNCCQRTLDHNDVPWIQYCLAILENPWIQSEVGMENELTTCLLSCATASELHWAQHNQIKSLWDHIWERISNKKLDMANLKNYVELAVKIMQNVEVSVYDSSPIRIVKTVVGILKTVAESADSKFWTHSRKYSYVFILSFVVDRWGIEARDFILQNVFDVVFSLMSLVSVEDCGSGDSKSCMMKLTDDLVKLATIEKIGKHKTIDEETEDNVKRLLRHAIDETLRMAHALFFSRQRFSIPENYVKYLARWIITLRELDPSFSEQSEDMDVSIYKKKNESGVWTLESLANLSFGATITPNTHKCNAWKGAIEILIELIASRKLEDSTVGKMISSLWVKRKSFSTDVLRSTFCSFLSATVSQYLNTQFGQNSVPSIDLILKYALSLMSNVTSLANSAHLIECILRFHTNEVSKEMHQAICDTVSRTSPLSIPVLRLLSAFISNTEFDENARFSSIEAVETKNWSLRIDMVKWLLAEPGASCHRLLYQLSRFHPVFCYDEQNPPSWIPASEDSKSDKLLESLERCHLLKLPEINVTEHCQPLDAPIDDIVNFIHEKLCYELNSDLSLPIFVLCCEFSLKYPLLHFDLAKYYQNVQTKIEDIDETDFLQNVEHFTCWPENLSIPEKSFDSLNCQIVFLFTNLTNQMVDFDQQIYMKSSVLEEVSSRVYSNPSLRIIFQQSMPFNNVVKKYILANTGDLYQTAKRFVQYSFLLSHRNMLATRAKILEEANQELEKDEPMIYDTDLTIFESMTASACVRNVNSGNKIGGYDLDSYVVAQYPENVFFDDRNVLQCLKSLKKSPFLAQNIVRHVLNNEQMWHLHGKVLKFVMCSEKLLTVCIATIPNMVRYLRIYQINLNPRSKSVKYLNLDVTSIRQCHKYIRNPTTLTESMTVDDLFVLFGSDKNKWAKPICCFWRLFERQPALVCEKLHRLATEYVELRLINRLAVLLKALMTSEFCKKVLDDQNLRTAFGLTYRSIYSLISLKDCSSETVELCQDINLKYDVFQHKVGKVPAPLADEFFKFETEMSFSVEKFLKTGIEADDVNFMDFGLVEFYRQLNENLTEEIIIANDKRDKYIIDFFSSVWFLLPSMRPQIIQIVIRFKHISPAWSKFPQPPHVMVSESTFLWRLRFNISMKIISDKKWKKGEYSTFMMILLTTFDIRHFRSVLIDQYQFIRLSNDSLCNELCDLSKILRKATSDYVEGVVNDRVFEAITRAAALFPDIAAFIIPFLFKICVDVKTDFAFAVGKLLECVKKEQFIRNNQLAVYCLAECVDAIGLDILAGYEQARDEENPKISTEWLFRLAKLFIKHGFLTHAFSIANIIFDRLSFKERNTMMIERKSLESVDKSDEIISLLADIYVAENNSVALSSLPPSLQTRKDVRRVMHRNAKEWLRLVSTDDLDARESTIVRWLCGLQSEGGDTFFDSILRCRFTEYPKIIDTSSKFIYFLLFHRKTDVFAGKNEIISKLINKLSLDEQRLLMLATDEALFESKSIEEHVVRAVRDFREIMEKRKRFEMAPVKELNEAITTMVNFAEILAENKAHEAASDLLIKWKNECIAWNHPSVDVDLVEVCQWNIMCLSGDVRMAEINLRLMQPRFNSMSEAAVAEWTLVLSKITLEYRNDLDEGVRLLERGCKRLLGSDSVEIRLKLLLKFHSVCLNQLSKLEEYRESRSFRMKKEAISVFEQQINAIRVPRGNSGDGESRRAMQRVKREQQCEKDDVEKVQRSVLTAAQKAVASAFDALECINQLDDEDEAIRTASLIVFPLIDLIYKYEHCPDVAILVKEHANQKLVSKLWLCATSHIASKTFSTETSPIQRYLYQMLCRLICDYPYHVLPSILMYEFEQSGAKVRNFLNSIFKRDMPRDMSKLEEICKNMREAHIAYRELAKLDTKENIRLQRVQIDGKTMFRIPADLRIFKCKLQKLPIPTVNQKITWPGNYSTDSLITWKSWKEVFSIADGLSAPKIWEIQGSDGKWYKTVWKKDDVRQDVLVEQMFDVTNNMLDKRMLRTYNVLPLDTECGIIEFCGGTVSLKEMLCGVSRDKGLHQEIFANEPSAVKVSMMMKNVQMESTETRRKVFVDICKQYTPVFRHFFYRNFPTSHIWREKIHNYRKSLATWSVVCYIVGLGDRHASNILFDQKQCTFVHIDLGMILEYSKRTLPVPEQVPFRISRDLLDPILIEGIENGQLASDCTETIEKLKQHGKVILGVASALLRETMSNFRETEQASGRPSYISEMAIGRLRDKLEGTDEGVTAQTSNLQVRRLLREATNADNLSRMFCGWMPYL